MRFVKHPSYIHFSDGGFANGFRSYSVGIVQRVIKITMLWTIVGILVVMWLLGMVSSYTLGGFLHVLLVIALVVAVIQLLQGRRTVV